MNSLLSFVLAAVLVCAVMGQYSSTASTGYLERPPNADYQPKRPVYRQYNSGGSSLYQTQNQQFGFAQGGGANGQISPYNGNEYSAYSSQYGAQRYPGYPGSSDNFQRDPRFNGAASAVSAAALVATTALIGFGWALV